MTEKDEIARLQSELDKTKSELDGVKNAIAKITAENMRPGNYKEMMDAIQAGITQQMSTPRLNEAIMGHLRNVQISRDDVISYMRRSSEEAASNFLARDGRQILADAVVSSRHISEIINSNVAALLQKRTFIEPLVAAFRESITSNPVAVGLFIDALSADTKGLLAQSLANNTDFMDRQTQSILVRMRDALATY